MLVLDASVILSAILSEAESPAAARVLDRVAEAGAQVPALWWLEVANGLLQAGRRGRIDAPRCEAALARLRQLPFTTDPEPGPAAWSTILPLARTHELPVYDATYLELAIRLRLPLASFDAALRRVAGRTGVPILP